MENLICILTSFVLGMTSGFICLLAASKDPFRNLSQEIEDEIKTIDL